MLYGDLKKKCSKKNIWPPKKNSIENSEKLSKMLRVKNRHLDHQVLNAKAHAREATIIAQAGMPGAVTIATNMAGRGVDILLGGSPDIITRQFLRKRRLNPDATDQESEEWIEATMENLADRC